MKKIKKIDFTYEHYYGTFTGKIWRETDDCWDKPVEVFKCQGEWGFRSVADTIAGLIGIEKTGYATQGRAMSAGKQCKIDGRKAVRALGRAGL
ncbi:MAG: hypothetical protein GY797_23125 [Deltaproteobacteria bacterium]|nr:hypothetical protein [Deltaproteobacteria bacterium]